MTLAVIVADSCPHAVAVGFRDPYRGVYTRDSVWVFPEYWSVLRCTCSIVSNDPVYLEHWDSTRVYPEYWCSTGVYSEYWWQSPDVSGVLVAESGRTRSYTGAGVSSTEGAVRAFSADRDPLQECISSFYRSHPTAAPIRRVGGPCVPLCAALQNWLRAR